MSTVNETSSQAAPQQQPQQPLSPIADNTLRSYYNTILEDEKSIAQQSKKYATLIVGGILLFAVALIGLAYFESTPAKASEAHPECGQAESIDEDLPTAKAVSHMFGDMPFSHGTVTDPQVIAAFEKASNWSITSSENTGEVKTIAITNFGSAGFMAAGFNAQGCFVGGDPGMASDPEADMVNKLVPPPVVAPTGPSA